MIVRIRGTATDEWREEGMPNTKGNRPTARKIAPGAARRTRNTAPAKLPSMGERLCEKLGGTWVPNANGSGGVCNVGTKLLGSINVYRGDPCQDVDFGPGKYILVPHSRNVMAALKQAMKSGG